MHTQRQVSLASLIVLLLIIFSPTAHTQYLSVSQRSLDVPVAPAAIALGESFTAKRDDPDALYFNPATLASVRGVTTSYGFRNLDWATFLRIQYTGLRATAAFPFGTIAVFYNRFSNRDLISSTPANPMGLGTVDIYDYTYGIAFARPLNDSWDAGVTVKRFNTTEDYFADPNQPSSPPSGALLETESPTLFDLGVVYHRQGFLKSVGNASDEYSLGIAAQNFGTDYRTRGIPAGQSTGQGDFQFERLPHYLRIGVAYNLSLGNYQEPVVPFGFSFTGEYRNVLNMPEEYNSEKDYWGFGMESRFFEILSLRAGGFLSGSRSVYGNKGTPSMRYGMGLQFPFRQLGINTPISLAFDYSAIPTYAVYFYGDRDVNKNMRAYSLTLRYTPSSGPTP